MKLELRAQKLAQALRRRIRPHAGKKIAIPMSAGVDSHCALFAALDEGIRPEIFSFHLKDVNSRDFRIAANTAAQFGLPFHEVVLPTQLNKLVFDVKKLAAFGCKSKTDFECFWPMTYLLPAMSKAGVKTFFTGHGADSLYCMSRKANQHFKGREDEFRAQAFANPLAFQRGLISNMCESLGLTYCPIFYCQEVLRLFDGASYEDLHHPVQKAVSRFAFPDRFSQVKVYGHTSFQLGDSGIQPHFEMLVSSELNYRGHKSVKGVYNDLVKKYDN